MIIGELTWQQFKQLNNIRNLPLNEQVRRYNTYLDNLNNEYINWLSKQPKGPRPLIPQETGFLLQEDLFDLEQEDGSKILIT